MPTYTYHCNECENEFDKKLKMSEYDQPISEPCPKCLKENSINRILSKGPEIGDAVRLGIRKLDNGFKEVLQKIDSKYNRHSNLSNRW